MSGFNEPFVDQPSEGGGGFIQSAEGLTAQQRYDWDFLWSGHRPGGAAYLTGDEEHPTIGGPIAGIQTMSAGAGVLPAYVAGTSMPEWQNTDMSVIFDASSDEHLLAALRPDFWYATQKAGAWSAYYRILFSSWTNDNESLLDSSGYDTGSNQEHGINIRTKSGDIYAELYSSQSTTAYSVDATGVLSLDTVYDLWVVSDGSTTEIIVDGTVEASGGVATIGPGQPTMASGPMPCIFSTASGGAGGNGNIDLHAIGFARKHFGASERSTIESWAAGN